MADLRFGRGKKREKTYVQQRIFVQRLIELILREALGDDPLPHLLDTQLPAIAHGRSATILHRPYEVIDLAARALVAATPGFVVQARFADFHQPQRFIYIIRYNFAREPQAGERLGKTQDSEEGSGGGVREVLFPTFVPFLLLSHADVGADHVLGDFFGDGRSPAAGLGDILPYFVGGEDDSFRFRVFVVHVYVGDVLGEFLVRFAVRLVEHEEEDIETREQGGGEVDVLDGGDARVVAPVEGVCGG